MAKDDLSVNINVGVNLDKASMDKANEQIEKLEANIDRLNSKQIAPRSDLKKEFQKELGFGQGVKVQVGGYNTGSMTNKAKADAAQSANQFAQELSQMLGLEFINEFASTIGEQEFKVPQAFALKAGPSGSPQYEKALKQATEDFIVTSASNVVISPDMALAALERVVAKNPNAYMQGNLPGRTSGIIKPTPAFGETANFDQEVTNQFNNFLNTAIGENQGAADRVSQFLESKLKVLFSKIIDEGQKARERTFTSSRVSEGDDAAEGLVRYADDAARKAMASMEQRLGLQSGSTALYGAGMVPEKFRSRPEATSDPAALLNVLIGEYQDEVTGALMASLPDPSQVANPIAQVLMNPYILGDKFATGYEQEVGKLLKSKAATTAATVTPVAEPAKGGALNPNVEMLRKYLTEQKALVDAQGKTFMAGLDTEFNSQIDEKLTELGLVIKDGTGKFVEIFKFLQLPNDVQALEAGGRMLPPGSVKTPKDLLRRGDVLGIPKEDIGVPDDAEANFMQYRGKILKLVEVVTLLNDLGIQLTGSNFQAAEAANIKKAIAYVNQGSAERGIAGVEMPDLSNVFDPAKMAKQLSGGSAELAKIFDSPEAKSGISGALGHLIKNIAQQFPDFIARYSDQFKMAESGGFEFKAPGGAAPAHYAVTDAAASLIVKDFVEEFGNNAATLLIPVAKDLNTKVQAASGGSGSGKPPIGGTAAGDKPEDDPFANRAGKSLEKLLLVGKQYEQAVAGLTEAEVAKVNQRLEILKKSESQAEILARLAELEKQRFDILAEASEVLSGSSGFARSRVALGDLSPQGPLTQQDDASVKRYDQQVIAATKLGTAIKELTIAGQQNERQVISTVKEQARQGQVTEALTQNMRKEIDAKLANAQAGKAATNSIKAQMQDQVNAQRAVQRQTESLMQTWVTSRYALYDIGNFYQNVAQNLIRVSRQIFDTTQSYRRFETSFTSVERAMQLTGQAAVDMRDQFVLLSETIPVAFEDIARIGTLGAQMGIASDGIIEFTRTVSEFAAVTGISAETVAQQFGRIAELADVDSSDFNKLGSAVAFAGINAVATEAEILILAQSIAAVSNQSGITAPQIIGIATALASVGIQAEQARGVFTRVFADIDRAAQSGGESLNALAEITGLSAETISGSWGQEGAANDVFIALLKGLDSADNLTAAFDKLNIVETREINTLTRLAKNIDVVQQALSDSGTSFESGAFLTEAFGRTVDNLDSKITIFRNNLDSLAAALSSGFALVLGRALDIGSEFLKFLKSAEDSLLFTGVLPFAAVLAAFGAGMAGFAAITAKVTAQVYAFRVAMINMANNPSAVDGIFRQTKALMGLGSGLIEVRDQVSGINERGLIEPVNFSNSALVNVKKQQAELLKTRNIYLSMGDVAKESMGKEAARSLSAVQLSRKEADAVNNLLLSKRLEIETLENSQNPADIAKAATMRQAYSQAYVVSVGGEIRVLSALELQEQRNIIAASNLSRAKKAQALAHLDNATAINLETKAASNATGKIGSLLSRIVGVAAIVGTAVIAIDLLVKAFDNLNKINLGEVGGGIESLREAIKQDTLAVREGTMEAVATASVEYIKYGQATSGVVTAVKNFTGVSKEASVGISDVTEEIKSQTVALGQNTKEWLANALFKWVQEQDIDFGGIEKSMADLGFNFDDVISNMVASANNAEIDISSITEIENKIDELEARRTEIFTLNENKVFSGFIGGDPEIDAIEDEIAALNTLKTTLNGVFDVLNNAFSETRAWAVITEALGLEEVNNQILGLVDRFKAAQESGKGFKKVFADLKVAAIALTGATGDDLLEIRSQETLVGLRAVLQGMLEAAKAASILEIRAIKASKALLALKAADKLEIESIEDAIASLDAIILALGTSAKTVGGAAESMADKIARLLDEASSGTEKVAAFRDSIRALGKALAESTSFNLNEAVGAGNTSALLGVIDSIGARSGSVDKTVRDLQIFKLVLQDMAAPARAIKLVDNALRGLDGATNITKKRARELRREFANLFNTFQTNFTAGAAEVTSDVENKVKSLTDFVGELGNVLRSTFDIRYGRQTALDALTGGWLSLTEAATQAQDAVKNANNEINQSVADRSVLQYQLSVAERYKDEKRSVTLRAKLATLDQKIVEQNKQLADANSAASTELTGNSKAAIDNRAKIRELVTQYNSYLIALANTNMDSTKLNAEAAKLEKEFMSQAKALGFAEEELKSYTQAFRGDFTKVLNGIPRDITLTVNTDPALRAIQEFVAQAKAALSQISVTAPAGPVTPPGQRPTEQFFNLPGMTNTRPGPEIDGKKGDVVTGPKGTTWAWNNRQKEWDRVAKKAMGGYISGPGSATSDSIPAMLSNGEYVIQAKAVGAYGLDFMNALNQQRVGFSPMQASSSAAGGGSSVVYLSPEDRALLRAAVDRPIALYTENTRIAQSANAGNVLLAQRGTN